MKNKKFVFIIDNKHLSAEYTMKEILELSEEEILENMEVCTCEFTENCNHCECEPEFEESEITGFAEFVCLDKNSKSVYSNSKVKYYDNIHSLIYNTNGWYIDDGICSNFDEKDIEVVAG